MRSLIAAGEFFFDLIFYQLQRLPKLGEELVTRNFGLALGGGAPNTALAAARLGSKVQLATVLGDTVLDDFAIGELKKHGIGASLIRRERKSMGAVTVSVSLPQDRFFLTYPGSNTHLDKYLLAPATRRSLGRSSHVHFALSPRNWEPYAHLAGWLKRESVTTSWDLGWHPEAVKLPGFRALYAGLDVIFLNKIEALRYTGEKSPEKAIRKISSPGQVVVVKLGEAGAMAIDDGTLVTAKGIKVDAIDTTGAGDAFNGGFLHAWMDRLPLIDCLRAGNVCGAFSTTKPGGNAALPNKIQLARALRNFR